MVLKGLPVNVIRKTKLLVNSYSFSPDGAFVVFESRVPSKDATWQTNTDIYLVDSDGARPCYSISSYNLGYDTLPAFSPDGKSITWLQMQTPGYESDLNKIVLFDLGTKATRIVVSDWDRSAESITWSSGTVFSSN